MHHICVSSLLAQDSVASGEGIEHALKASWLWPAWLIVVGVLSVSLLVVLLYLGERGRARIFGRLFLASLRIALIGLVLLMLFGWILERNRTDLPDVILLIDDSKSMNRVDRYDDERLSQALAKRVKRLGLNGASRVNLAKALMLEDNRRTIKQLREKYNLKIYRLGGSARAISLGDSSLADQVSSLTANEQVSRLGKGLRDVLEQQRGRPTAAVIMLTDGITTEGKSIDAVAPYARRKAIPLFMVGLGSDRAVKDLRLTDLIADDVVFVDDVMYFEVKLTGFGYEGVEVTVRLRQGEQGPTLASTRVRVGEDGKPQTVRLAHRPAKKGDFTFVVEVDPLAEESDTDNNKLSKTVSVRDETIRVLLAQSYPSFEFRFLTSLLGRLRSESNSGSSRSIDLTVVLQQADQGFAIPGVDVRRVFPVRRDELFDYDVLIVGDVDPSGWSRPTMENIVDFVTERGGGIVFSAGPRYAPWSFRDTPLAALLPVDVSSVRVPDPLSGAETKFQVRPTELGLSTPHMQLGGSPRDSLRVWDHLEGILWMVEAPELKAAARVLAEHPTRTGPNGQKLPVIVMQFMGAGKVIFHATDETYRWRARIGDKYFGQYWLQTIRYLSRAKLLGKNRTAELSAAPATARRGEPIFLRVNFFDDRLAPAEDDGVTVIVENETGKRTKMKLSRAPTTRGVFENTSANFPEGEYRAWLASPSLEGVPPSVKFSVIAPPGETSRLEMNSAGLKEAAKITGGRYYTVKTMDDLLDDLPKGRHERIGTLPPRSLWSIWWVAVAFAGVFLLLIVTEWLLRKRFGML